MSEAKLAVLPDRGVVSVTGADAAKLLAGIITNDVDLLDTQPAIFAGLLSPQGKVLFEFFVVKVDGGYLLDVDHEKAGDLAKRLTMYKLRAKVSISDATAEFAVAAAWGHEIAGSPAVRMLPDPRATALGYRVLASRSIVDAHDLAGIAHASQATADVYHAHRIALGVPDGGKDYEFGDAFAHEANFDLNHGVAFDKGCYVGQEIVARMQHRGTVRKRVVRVTGDADLPASRPDIKVGDVVIGRLGSVAGRVGLALLRLDRAIEAIDKAEAITAEGIALTLDALSVARHRAVMAEKATSAKGAEPWV